MTPNISLIELRLVNKVAVLLLSPVSSIIVLEKVINDEEPKIYRFQYLKTCNLKGNCHKNAC